MAASAPTGHAVHTMERCRWWPLGPAALPIIIPGIQSGVAGLALATAVLLTRFVGWRRQARAPAMLEKVEAVEPLE